jgi:hypothetical protein
VAASHGRPLIAVALVPLAASPVVSWAQIIEPRRAFGPFAIAHKHELS